MSMTQAQVESQCLSINPFEGDDTDITLLTDKFVNTRKHHSCAVCQGRIKAGARCRARTERNNEERKVMTFYFCPICCRAEAKAENDDGEAIERRYTIGKIRMARRHNSRQTPEVQS